jgi:hypothetical protein
LGAGIKVRWDGTYKKALRKSGESIKGEDVESTRVKMKCDFQKSISIRYENIIT